MKRNIKEDYLSGVAPLRSFYRFGVQQPDFSEVIAQRAQQPVNRTLLQTILQKQYAGRAISPKTRENLDRLGQENTFTVTTGHQLVLMGGPMFSVYKILSVIRLAENLARQHPDQHFVPVFWLASEDHDAAEVNHYFRGFMEKLTYNGPLEGAVGRAILAPEVQEIIPPPFQSCYEPGITLAEAHRRWADTLFGKYGLVVLDADDPQLKASFVPIMEAELFQRNSQPVVQATSEKLAEAGYPNQVYAREINLFYLSPGRRDRIVFENGIFHILDTETTFSPEAMREHLHQFPERFSPNVILRPQYQEFILPNLAYSGGWGELAYWLQLKDLFEARKLFFPLLLPRMTVTLIPREVEEAWTKMGFAREDLSKELYLLNKQLVSRMWDKDELAGFQAEFAQVYQHLADFVSQFEPTLARSVEAQKHKSGKFLERLEKKIGKTIRNRNPEPFQEMKRLKDQVQPGRELQERILNLSAFSLPAETLIDFLYQHCSPLTFTHQWIPLP